jgi:hypothetical protein
MIVYPNENYDSWISEDEADIFFEKRLNSSEWNNADKEAALIMAFNDINLLLNLDVDLLNDETPLPVLKAAQAEQALYLLKTEIDTRSLDAINLGSGLYIKLGGREPRIARQVLEILTEYIAIRTIERIR